MIVFRKVLKHFPKFNSSLKNLPLLSDFPLQLAFGKGTPNKQQLGCFQIELWTQMRYHVLAT